jgi:hypothetical protein
VFGRARDTRCRWLAQRRAIRQRMQWEQCVGSIPTVSTDRFLTWRGQNLADLAWPAGMV